MTDKNMNNKVNEAICDICIDIIKDPLIYFSEADIQMLLSERLRRLSDFSKLKETGLHRGKNSHTFFKTSLLHREYGAKNGRRFDVVILPEDEIKEINKPDLTRENFPIYLTPSYAFEIGTEKSGPVIDRQKEDGDIEKGHLSRDLKKLCEASEDAIEQAKEKPGKSFNGYSINIYRDTAVSAKNTSNYQNTQDRIEREFKTAFVEAFKKPEGIPNNIKVLAIVLHPYKLQKKALNKCEIFNSRTKKWVPTNISKDADLKKAILKELE